MPQLVECVPNFSNGRDPKVYHSIADAIRAVRGAQVLDVSADPDHNRTVITFVGQPEAVEEAAFQAIARAKKLINMEEHSGEHPRIGATDVCPFVPVQGVSSEDCVAMARRLGQRVGNELAIAVYLYGEAASRPERKKLAHIRRGEYEGWKAEVATHPERAPDFGPAEPRPWGATVIGVRPFLLAYNIYLNSNNVEIADAIARAVRFSSGGLRFVQAKGFLVEGRAQVSMNLTHYEKTPIYRVQEMVRREAARYGLTITKAELIGLTPQQALVDAAQWYLQLDDLKPGQILEHRLQEEAAEDNDTTPHDFLSAVAANTPTPGGGSCAALAGALGAALTQMVAGLTAGRKKYADFDTEAQQILTEADGLRSQLATAIKEDAAAFDALMAAYRERDLDDAKRAAAIEKATLGAAQVPLQVAEMSLQVGKLGQRVTAKGNRNAVTDGATAVVLAQAAVQAAAMNVKINAVGLKDKAQAEKLKAQVEAVEMEMQSIATATLSTARERGNF